MNDDIMPYTLSGVCVCYQIQDLAPKVAMEVTEHENDPESC